VDFLYVEPQTCHIFDMVPISVLMKPEECNIYINSAVVCVISMYVIFTISKHIRQRVSILL
jgi:hypothetical protein